MKKAKSRLKRTSGILLPVFSLPGSYGIGDFGSGAEIFLNFLEGSGQGLWQILPLTPVEGVYGHSPYSSPSAFAGNPLFLSPELLLAEGLLTAEECQSFVRSEGDRVDYEAARKKRALTMKAVQRLASSDQAIEERARFERENRFWLDDYALFVLCKMMFSHARWCDWPEPYQRRHPAALKKLAEDQASFLNQIKAEQFLLDRQWQRLRQQARRKGIQIVGDLPIYVNYDSADVWSFPENYKLDENGLPTHVAGVPPDYFSATGQRWGNPVYNWDVLARKSYFWWVERIRHQFRWFDAVRIDHFRGLVAYWEIPAEEKTAVNGHWVSGPADDLLSAFYRALGDDVNLIAEDLGLITPDVTEVMKRNGLPGMKVLQFAFSEPGRDHPYLPENYAENSIVYTGTHDNNTTQGWWKEDATSKEKAHVRAYFGEGFDPERVHDHLIRCAWESRAAWAIVPLADVLGLGSEARINRPGTLHGNWQWRVREEDLGEDRADFLRRLTEQSGRLR